MQTFIQQIIADTLEKHPGQLSRLCFVFPTRRAGLFFKRELSKKLTQPIWAPGVLGIQDFIQVLTAQQIPDKLTLLFELYQSYKKYLPEESFERFYPWGQMLLKDYDEIDRYLVDAPKIFRNIQDLKNIDTEFSMAEDDVERIRTFWKTFSDRDLSALKKEFLTTWEVLGKVYPDYKKRLSDKNMLYEGLAYRAIAEKSSDDLFSLPFFKEYDKVIFAGFYALSTSEEIIIQHLVKHNRAETYWDGDSYYMDDERQEAGKFLRKTKIVPPGFNWKGNYFEEIEKTIEIIGVPLQVGQAKALGTELKMLFKEEKASQEKTVVVLPDENMLFPVLYSLPESIKAINVTMGYPLHYTPLYALFEFVINLHKNVRIKDGQAAAFYHRDVMNILTHPYMQLIGDVAIREWVRKYEESKWIYISSKHLYNEKAPAFFPLIFQAVTTIGDAFTYFLSLLHLIQNGIKAQEAEVSYEKNMHNVRMESEYIYHFYTQLKRLQDIVKEYEVSLTLASFWNLFKEIIHSSKIPFTGEPLQGLQVMGFLETRVLDFETVFILSVNEDVLPASSKGHSFIPYSLRKGYGLPTFEEQDAVYAYHFYRLLQRAKTIKLYHNTEVKSLTAGEKSRYLLQIEYELKKKLGDKLTLTKKLISTDIQSHPIVPITVEKTEEVIKRLVRYFVKAGDDPTYIPKFSATALSSYINCKMQFYFRYIAKLKELEEVEDFIEANTFGSILHKAMEFIYGKKGEIDKQFIDQEKKRIDAYVLKAVKEVFPSLDEESELDGKNLLLKQVIVELVSKILDSDKKDLPFQILDLEKKVEHRMEITGTAIPKEVILTGYIDRIDSTEDTIRILDYKTGDIKLRDASIEELFTSTDHKVAFQGYFYAWLYWKQHPDKNIRIGIYPVQKLNEGIKYINSGHPIATASFEEFEQRLRKLLQEIFTQGIAFSQVEDETQCLYCPYIGICNK